jgi:hypothetical protein
MEVKMSSQGEITLDTQVSFSTNDYFYLNRGASDTLTAKVYAYQSVGFCAWQDVFAYLAISHTAHDALLETNLPAIPDFRSLLCSHTPSLAFTLPAWNALLIGVPPEAIQARANTGGERWFVCIGRRDAK